MEKKSSLAMMQKNGSNCLCRVTIRGVTALMMAMMTVAASAQDVMITTDGDVMNVWVDDIGSSTVYYRLESGTDGAIQRIEKSRVYMIKRADGTRYDLGSNVTSTTAVITTPPAPATDEDKEATALAAQKNREAIAAVNGFIPQYCGKDHGSASRCVFIMNVSEQSQIVNEDIELSFDMVSVENENKTDSEVRYTAEGKHYYFNPCVLVSVTNKTEKTIYIDLGNTFYISNGEPVTYYTPTATTTSHSSSAGAGFNVGALAGAVGLGGVASTLAGGLTVGGSGSTSTSTVTYSQRVLAVPPRATKKLDLQPLFNRGKEIITDGLVCNIWKNPRAKSREMLVNFRTSKKEDKTQSGQVFTYAEETSPIKLSSIVTYSFSEGCEETESCAVDFFLKHAVAIPFSSGYHCGNLDECLPDYKGGFFFIGDINYSVWDWKNGHFPRE